MKNRAILTLSLLALSACGPSGAPGNGVPQLYAQPAWTSLTEKTACGSADPRNCAGAYGFTVTHDGRYTIGPAPGGQTATGQIDGSSLAQLNGDALMFAGVDPATTASCGGGISIAGVADDVQLTLADGTGFAPYGLFTDQGSDCTRGDRTSALQLHVDLRALMGKYYTTPFP
jgi:hypothetical protein